jgi:hypothetical protein
LISDAVTAFSGEERAAAKNALQSVSRGCSNRIGWRLAVPALRVSRIELQPGYAEGLRRYRAEVREFTLFGVPLGTTIVHADGDLTCAF